MDKQKREKNSDKSSQEGLSQMQKKLIVFSAVLFLVVFVVGGIAFTILMERNLVSNSGNWLAGIIATEQVKLEASVNSEKGMVLKMANSPLIKRYFANPEDPELEYMAFEEFGAFEKTFASGMVFWINDIDRLFYFSGAEPYELDPAHPDNYWYMMTLFEIGSYNFNINYNPDIDMMNLWINAPVFDEENNPIGMVGGGINLTEFIDAMYDRSTVDASVYLFNTYGEITGARDMEYIANKTGLDEKLGQIGVDILEKSQTLKDGETIFFEPDHLNGVVVLGSVPSLDWSIVAIQRFSPGDSLKNGMTVLFSIMIVVLLVIIVIFDKFAIKLLYESEQAKSRAEEANKTITESINYASKIQGHLLPSKAVFDNAFSDYYIIWKPRDIVGGDIYWAENFDNGTVICVCDCTGHGTPGALLTMLVVSAFESIITEKNCSDTAEILYLLDKKLSSVLHVGSDEENRRGIMDINDGCDLAVLFIDKGGNITTSAGNISIFTCDGEEVKRHKGQSIFIGEGSLSNKDEVKTIKIPANPENKFYVSSDGLFDQVGDEKGRRFGYKRFEKLILENHNEDLDIVLNRIWFNFEEHRGAEPRRDDFELIAFKL